MTRSPFILQFVTPTSTYFPIFIVDGHYCPIKGYEMTSLLPPCYYGMFSMFLVFIPTFYPLVPLHKH